MVSRHRLPRSIDRVTPCSVNAEQLQAHYETDEALDHAKSVKQRGRKLQELAEVD